MFFGKSSVFSCLQIIVPLQSSEYWTYKQSAAVGRAVEAAIPIQSAIRSIWLIGAPRSGKNSSIKDTDFVELTGKPTQGFFVLESDGYGENNRIPLDSRCSLG